MIGITQPIVKHSIAVERADDIAQAVVDGAPDRRQRPARAGADRPPDRHGLRARRATRRTRRTCPATGRASGRTGARCKLAAEAIAAATAAGALRRRRRRQRGRVGGAARARGAHRRARHDDADGARRVPGLRPAWLGMLGMHGTRVANWAMDEADLIVAIGARFDDRVTGALDEFARDAKIVHIDVDPSEIGKIVAAHIPVVGDAKLALDRAAARPTRSSTPTPTPARGVVAPDPRLAGRAPAARAGGAGRGRLRRARVRARLARRRARRRDRHHRRRPAPDVGRRPAALRGAAALDHLRRARDDGLRPARPRSAPRPRARTRPVVCVSGEGSFLMNVQELATAVEEQLPVKVAAARQRLARHGPPAAGPVLGRPPQAVDLGASPDWELLARAFGWSARSIGDADEVEDALAETLAEPGPALLHVRIAPEANCLPMFRPGGAAREMIG